MRLASSALVALGLICTSGSGCTLDSTGTGGAPTASTTISSAMATTGNFMPTTATGALCGDGKVDPGEQCDSNDLANQTCKLQGFSGGTLDCNGSCALDVSGCVSTCGDGVKQASEACEGADVGTHTCVEIGYKNPAGVVCTDCDLDYTGCAPVCGNGTMEPGEVCDDGNMIDTDACPANCIPGNGGTCGSAVPITLAAGATMPLFGNLANGGNHTNGDAACPASGADRVYKITVATAGFLTAWIPRTNAKFDGALWISGVCTEGVDSKSELCNDTLVAGDASKSNGGDLVSIPVAAGDVRFLYVESKSATGVLTYDLNLRLSAGTCADPVPITLVEGSPQSVIGNNANSPKTANATGACSGGVGGGEVVYEVRNAFDTTTRVDMTGTGWNPVLYALGTCGMTSTQIDCSNGVLDSDPEQIDVVTAAAATPWYLYADGGDPAAAGVSTLVFTQ
jgi:cysteine-rich repeat protein